MSSVRTVCWPGASGNASVYENLIADARFPAERTVLDYPSLGAAAARPNVQSLDQLYQHVTQELPQACNLVAVSMGCVLALRAALEQPSRIRRLVLIAVAGGVDVLGMGGSDWRSGWVTRRPDAPRWFIDDRSDFSARLGEIRIPTLLIFGDADPVAPVAVGQFLRERLPSSRLEVLAGADHNLVEQRAAEVAPLVVSHFQEPG